MRDPAPKPLLRKLGVGPHAAWSGERPWPAVWHVRTSPCRGVAVAPSWHGSRGSNFSEPAARKTRCPPDPQAPPRAPILARCRRDEHLFEGIGRPRPAGRRAGSPGAAGSWTPSPPGLGQRSIREADAPRDGSRTPLPSRSAQPSPGHLPTIVRAKLGHVNRLRPAPIRGSSAKRTNAAPVRRVALSSGYLFRLP